MLLSLWTTPLLRLPDGAIIYASDVPFQYNERHGRYTEFVANPKGINFVVAWKDHEILLHQRSNAPNMSINLNNFRQLNVTGHSSNLIQIAAVNPGDMSHPTYYAWKRYAHVEHLSRTKIMLSSCEGGINLLDPVHTRKTHEELIN